ncbi:DUF2946 family protein [Raoultella sp. BIGb0138]|uniref:DUF2946 domain-containing protein n=1 Tax=Raoultella sp. BIGb0138 TaxID=2485115 RepID=UPI0010438412|nr:DUF2946 domain-containing protein [Raoultella sp. BIGb0138]TCW05647.1 DUF2946 family protein [Raoultella sp. BIGb0138]
MASKLSQQSAFIRRAAWLALFSILLIVVAPLISVSLQKDPMSAMPGMHHAMMTAAMPQDMAMTHPASPASESPHTMPLDHAEACGYCVLLAHVPGLLFALALLISCILRRVCAPTPCLVLKRRHYFPWLYPDTRAPPRRSAFSAS